MGRLSPSRPAIVARGRVARGSPARPRQRPWARGAARRARRARAEHASARAGPARRPLDQRSAYVAMRWVARPTIWTETAGTRSASGKILTADVVAGPGLDPVVRRGDLASSPQIVRGLSVARAIRADGGSVSAGDRPLVLPMNVMAGRAAAPARRRARPRARGRASLRRRVVPRASVLGRHRGRAPGLAIGRRRVLELPDRLRGTPHRPAAGPAVGGHQPQQEDDRLARDQQQEDHDEQQGRADRRRPVPHDGQRREDDSTTRTITWNRKQPRPGPRAGSRSEPLYWIGPVGRGRRGGVGSAFGSSGWAADPRTGRAAACGSVGRVGISDGRVGRAVSSVTMPRPAAAARSRAPRRPRRRAARAGSPASR